MHSVWQEWLSSQAPTEILKTGDVPPAAAGRFIPLSGFALLRASGEDAQNFLQSQLSSDIRLISSQSAQYSTYSNAKGRMQGSFLIWLYQGDYYLLLKADIADRVRQRLSMFILRSKVKLERVDAGWGLVGLISDEALSDHDATGLKVSATEREVRIQLDATSALLLFESPQPADLARLAAQMRLADEAFWTLRDIRAGIGWVSAATYEAFVPQMANMEVIGAISFQKGCYPGQEIVARTQYLGKVKRRMYRVLASIALEPGQPLFGEETGEQAIGAVVESVALEGGTWEGLVVVQSAAWEEGVHYQSLQGPLLEKLELPYSVD